MHTIVLSSRKSRLCRLRFLRGLREDGIVRLGGLVESSLEDDVVRDLVVDEEQEGTVRNEARTGRSHQGDDHSSGRSCCSCAPFGDFDSCAVEYLAYLSVARLHDSADVRFRTEEGADAQLEAIRSQSL